jgi:hypothetical protein
MALTHVCVSSSLTRGSRFYGRLSGQACRPRLENEWTRSDTVGDQDHQPSSIYKEIMFNLTQPLLNKLGNPHKGYSARMAVGLGD